MSESLSKRRLKLWIRLLRVTRLAESVKTYLILKKQSKCERRLAQ